MNKDLLSTFSSASLLEQAQAILDQFNQPDVDGVHLYEQLRDLVIQECDWRYEQLIKNFSYGMEFPTTAPNFSQAVQWLDEHLDGDQYLLHPYNTRFVGSYQDRKGWIYFKQPSQATLFKLTWK